MKTKEANLPSLLGIVNLMEAQELVRTVFGYVLPILIAREVRWFRFSRI